MSWGSLAAVRGRVARRPSGLWRLASLEAKVPLAIKLAVPVVITTAGLTAFMASIVATSIESQIKAEYERQASVVADGAAATFAENPNNIAQVDDYLGRVVESNPDLVSVRIHSLDRGTTVIASSKPSEIGATGLLDADERDAVWSGRSRQDQDDGDRLTTVAPLRAGDLLYGGVVIESRKEPELAAIRSATIVIGIAAAIAIAMESVFMLFTLYFAILRRTRRIQRAVNAVASGDTTVRLPEGDAPHANDEIIKLAASVDHMIVSLEGRRQGDRLIRTVARKALEGAPTDMLVAEALTATRELIALESCMFATVDEHGKPVSWIDGATSTGRPAGELPVWVFALTAVAVDARQTVLTNRAGRLSRFAGAPGVTTDAEAAIVPLPRSGVSGHAIIAIARERQTLGEGALPVLDAVAAVIAESLHMQAADNARAESAVKSRVMSAVSHEMRNPLNSILGFTGLVIGDGNTGLTEKQRRQLGYVQASARNMLDLVNNYLDLSRVRSGKLALQYETVNVAQLVGDVIASVVDRASAKSIVIRASVDPAAAARVDPVRVRQVLANLLSNAIAFTPREGKIYVRARIDAGAYRFVVSDTGVGIKKDQRELVFTEFSKIDAGAMAAAKGTGLGLVLTQSLVKAMGGDIRLYSRPGRGTTVSVSLPRTESARKSAA